MASWVVHASRSTSATTGKSPRQIAIDLNKEGIPSPKGGLWSDKAIRGVPALQTGVLYNHLYIGQLVWNRRRDLRDPDTGRSRHRVNPASEWVYAQAPHLRIIDDELWEAAKAKQLEFSRIYQEALAKGAEGWRAAASGIRPLTLLSGLIVCGVCGGTVAKRGNNRLACVAHIKGKGCSNASAVRADSLETRVLVGLREQMMTPDMMADAIRAFIEESNQLNQQRRANEGADRQRLGRLRSDIGVTNKRYLDRELAPAFDLAPEEVLTEGGKRARQRGHRELRAFSPAHFRVRHPPFADGQNIRFPAPLAPLIAGRVTS